MSGTTVGRAPKPLRRSTIASLCCATAMALLARSSAAEELADLASRVKPAVVHLVVLDRSGEKRGTATGFFLSEDGLIATNHHVIENAEQMRARLPGGGTVDILGVMADDAKRDLAILQAAGDGYTALPLGDDADAKEGVPVAVIGGPLGLSWTLSAGIVSAVRDGLPDGLQPPHEQRTKLIQITAPISPGSSGSPVVTMDGRVIGVVQSTIPEAANLSFAVPVGALRQLLSGIHPGARPRPLHPFPWRNVGISVIVFAGIGIGALIARLLGRRGDGRGPRLVR